MKMLADALRTIANQCGTFANAQPALDYAAIGNVARDALAAYEAQGDVGGWNAYAYSAICTPAGDKIIVPTPELRDRIVACVNAMQGVADPAALVVAAREALDTLGKLAAWDRYPPNGKPLRGLRDALGGAE